MGHTAFVDHASENIEQWAAAQFGGVELGHVARTRRAMTIAAALARRPGVSIPRLFTKDSDVKAAYTFLEDPRVDPDALQRQHRAAVLGEAAACGLVLLLEDGTEVSYTHRRERVEGLGSIANGKAHHQGFCLHTVLAVDCPEGHVLDATGGRRPLRLLGIADQQSIVRPWPPARAKPTKASKARVGALRETEVWERAVQRLGPVPAGTRWERVADREADFYENLLESQRLGYGYTIRAKHNRSLVAEVGEPKLFERIRARASMGGYEVALRARPQHRARTAVVSVSVCEVRIQAPQRPGAAPGTRPAVTCSVVRVWEATPPEGVEGLEWILLCDGEVTTYEQARERIARYASRWLIEEFHKGLKTGLGAEKLQLEQGASIIAMVAMMSVVALRLVELREHVRRDAEAPASESGLSELELEILRVELKREIRTVREVALAIGRLGGHMNRARDGMPGWITLWHGRTRLTLLAEGVRIARLLSGGG